MAAISNKTGVNRVAPAKDAKGQTSIDDDPRQRPEMVVGFTPQAMITANATTSPYMMIV